MQPLVAADELVGEGETGHEAALLHPEDGGERPGEEDALHARVGDHALSECGAPENGSWKGNVHQAKNGTFVLLTTGGLNQRDVSPCTWKAVRAGLLAMT